MLDKSKSGAAKTYVAPTDGRYDKLLEAWTLKQEQRWARGALTHYEAFVQAGRESTPEKKAELQPKDSDHLPENMKPVYGLDPGWNPPLMTLIRAVQKGLGPDYDVYHRMIPLTPRTREVKALRSSSRSALAMWPVPEITWPIGSFSS